MSKETYTFRLRGDHKILDTVTVTADSLSEAFTQVRARARLIPGVTMILHGQGYYSI